MRKMIALLLVLMLVVAGMPVANAFELPPLPSPDNGGSGGSDGSGPVVGSGQQKEFAIPTGPAEETFGTWETDSWLETTVPVEEGPAEYADEGVQGEAEADSPAPKPESPEVPVYSGEKSAGRSEDSNGSELSEAMAMMKALMIVVIALVLILALLVAGFVVLYAKGILVLRKQSQEPIRTVTYVTKREEPVQTVRSEPGTIPTERPATQILTGMNPEMPKEADLPPIGQTVILRKSCEQVTDTQMTRKE